MISFPNQNFKKVPFKPVNMNTFNKPFTPRQHFDASFEKPASIKKINTRARGVSKENHSFKVPDIMQMQAPNYLNQDLKNDNRIEMFEKANFNLVDMMKLQKVQARQKYDDKKQRLALGQQVSAM